MKLNKRSVELFEENSDIPEKREAFSDALNKYFTAMHSNEIYIEIVFNK